MKETKVAMPLVTTIMLIAMSGCGNDPDPRFTREYIDRNSACEEQAESFSLDPLQIDIGASLHEFGRPAEWLSQKMFLGESCVQAAVGPVVYADEKNSSPSYYVIDIEVMDYNSSKNEVTWVTFFRRDFNLKDLPEKIVGMDIKSVVTFYESENKVIFDLSNQLVEVNLPDSMSREK